MATTRSKKLRRSAARKGKRVVRPKKVTYRGLFHGSMVNLSRRDKFGPRPIPQKIYKDEMAQLAVVVGKALPQQDWVRRYCNRHIQAAITDGYLLEHEGGALSVTPKARFRSVATCLASTLN
ncbi:hypothetical protein NM688_g4898 [Phlebia brevispora]|uniref:Uncharacterized protein n=1 Tax=Phlebia brevispora TaxID=194682 RepID=A0ACC1T1M8_9APHY|nr:hypothetical protein NM688_g4898 [Phlebia brevispora]